MVIQKSLQDTWRLYWRYAAISIRGQLQYRASFLMLAFGNLFATLIEFVGIWALFARFGSLRGWQLSEIALFYGMVGIAFAIAEAAGRGFDTFGNVVKAGDFDRLLLRPRSTAFQVAAQELQLMRFGRLLQASVVLTWAIMQLPSAQTSASLLLIALSIVGGTCLFYGLQVLQATLSFWTVEGLEIMNTVTYGGTETAQYPLEIYPQWMQKFFTYVIPLACINYLPSRVLLHHAGMKPDSSAIVIAWLSPFVGVLFLLLSFRLWNFGVRHYRSTGS